MKQFMTVLKFEIKSLIKTKSFYITTLIFVVLIAGAIFIVPLTGVTSQNTEQLVSETLEDKNKFVVYDENNVIKDYDSVFKVYFPNSTFKKVDSIKELKSLVNEGKADGGLEFKSSLNYNYYVINTSLMDTKSMVIDQAIVQNYKNNQYKKLGLNDKEAQKLSFAATKSKTIALGNDGAENLISVFILIMAIYMITIIYGQIIATRVASEKGNRTMELLVTSANTNSLIFGKVIAGCIVAFAQIILIVLTAFVSYKINASAWNGMLDMVFNIPLNVIIAFLLFGVTGFIFYAFIFGALGALVDKSEDVNSSATPITIIFVLVYMAVYFGVMQGPDSIIFIVASFVPFSSPMAMFARLALANVSIIEVLISLVLLVGSTILVGIMASKIYRRGTLMYGQEVKLVSALKWLKK